MSISSTYPFILSSFPICFWVYALCTKWLNLVKLETRAHKYNFIARTTLIRLCTNVKFTISISNNPTQPKRMKDVRLGTSVRNWRVTSALSYTHSKLQEVNVLAKTLQKTTLESTLRSWEWWILFPRRWKILLLGFWLPIFVLPLCFVKPFLSGV